MTILPGVFLRFAARSLWRNRARTILSIVGVAISCSLALAEISMVRAEINLYVKSVAEGGIGHFRVVPQGWAESHDPGLRLADQKDELEHLVQMPGVEVATPRARLQGMLAMGTKMAGVEIVGVDPKFEPFAFRYVRKMSKGRYLKPADSHQMVIGKSIADRLGVQVSDSIVVTVVDRSGEMKSEMFDVLGIIDLGSKQIEATLCHITLKDMETLSGLKGAGEIAVLVNKPAQARTIMQAFQTNLKSTDSVLSWDEISPELKFAVSLHEVMARLFTIILLFVAFVGVASAELTAVMERRREFAVLSAIGMSAKRVVSLIVSEAFMLGTLAWLLTMLLSGPALYYLSISGFRILSEESLTVLGAVFEPMYYPDFGPWFFAYSALLSYGAMIAASIYPAILTSRLDPAVGLRVAQ